MDFKPWQIELLRKLLKHKSSQIMFSQAPFGRVESYDLLVHTTCLKDTKVVGTQHVSIGHIRRESS